MLVAFLSRSQKKPTSDHKCGANGGLIGRAQMHKSPIEKTKGTNMSLRGRQTICVRVQFSPKSELLIQTHKHQMKVVIVIILLSSAISLTRALELFKGQHTKALQTTSTISIENELQKRPQSLPYRFRRQTSGTNVQQLGGQSSGATQAADGQLAPGSGQSDSSPNDPPDLEVLSSLKCDFGSADSPDLCKFKIIDSDSMNPLAHTSSLSNWALGSGRVALFLGGPLMDATGLQAGSNDTNGGYIFYETSNAFATTATPVNATHMPLISGGDYVAGQAHGSLNYHRAPMSHDQIITSHRVSVVSAGSMPATFGPSFMSPNLTAPGPSGMCLSFQYAIQGLSAEELRVYLSDQKTGRTRQIWSASESAASNWTKGEVLYSVTNQHSLVFTAMSSPNAIVKELQQRKFRGHLALDEINIEKHVDPTSDPSACKGHCNFDGSLCGWTNGEDGQEDDFDWSFGRGSDNLFTGPARDFTSSSNNELTGSYLYTDSGYPRRPGDRALLLSPMFQPTAVNEAMCMRFAVHMFGSGIGSLAIKLRYADEGASLELPVGSGGGASGASGTGVSSGQPGAVGQPKANQFSSAASSRGGSSGAADGAKSNDLVVWEMSGDAGNSWHQAQTSVSSSRSPFQVLIEGTVGENHLGNIAVDEISFSQGPCPTSPPVASKNYGDCTFEQGMCYWRNPDVDIHLDDLDWVRQADETSIHGPNFDHTLKKRSGSYLKLENTFKEPKSGTRAFLLSPVFQPKPSGSVQCLSFYYYMFMRSISSSGPNLGTIRVYLASNNELVPIWRLTNPISSPNWKHGRASLSTAIVDGQPQAPSKLFQIAFEGIWGDAASGAIALDDITVFDGACDLMPAEARSVPGECSFDVDMCSWSNKSSTYELRTNGQLVMSSIDGGTMAETAILDSSRSPFLQSVGSSAAGSLAASLPSSLGPKSPRLSLGWQLATVDSRPVNLQDHTYKAPIGYAYVDVIDSSASRSSNGASLAYPLQSAEVTVQSGQEYVQCLSFWFAAYGRQELNHLSVYLTQASAPPSLPEDGGPAPTSGGQSQGSTSPDAPASPSGALGADASPQAEQANAWKKINGKLLWSVSLRNITEFQRRKWLYGQVTVRADSNHIVRFLAVSNDGGFALDDISYFEGVCGTRPSHARVLSVEEEAAELAAAAGSGPKANGGAGSSGAGSSSGSSAGQGGGAGASSPAAGGSRKR